MKVRCRSDAIACKKQATQREKTARASPRAKAACCRAKCRSFVASVYALWRQHGGMNMKTDSVTMARHRTVYTGCANANRHVNNSIIKGESVHDGQC